MSLAQIICILLMKDKYKKKNMLGLCAKYTCMIIVPLKHIKHKIMI